jgi:copper chaperone
MLIIMSWPPGPVDVTRRLARRRSPWNAAGVAARSRHREDIAVTETVITVAGMTCEHCVTAVRGEISRLPGVTGVEVDLATGAVRITADPVPDRAALSAAVDEAGYELAG